MKKIFCVLFFFKCLFVFSQNETTDQVYTIVEEMPAFPGGNDAMMNWVKNKIESIGYPKEEKETGISGISYVNFVVDKQGNVTNVTILRGVDGGPGYDKVATQVVEAMPRWKPGKQNGRAVAVQYNLPIKFTVKKNQNSNNADYTQDNKSTKITIFKPEDNRPTSIGALPKIQEIQCLKWNYSLLARGIFLMNYEYQLQPKLSAEVGLGITYRDIFFEATHGPYFDNATFTASYNFCAEGGIRLYPKGFDNFEGLYLSPIVSYRKYSLSMPDSYSNITFVNTISSFKPGYNFLDLQLKFGYQYESLWNSDVIGDFYVGVAIRNVTINNYTEVHNTATGGRDFVSTQKQVQFPQFLIGLKVGMPF